MDTQEEEVKVDGQDETPEEKANKETKKYLRVIEIVRNVVGGDANLRPRKKIKPDETATLVAELFKEEEAELKENVKKGLKLLLKQHVTLETDVDNKLKELEKLKLEKRKEFTKAANAWLKQIDEGAMKSQAYVTALQTAFITVNEKKEEKKPE